jgi:hypothetical protein
LQQNFGQIDNSSNYVVDKFSKSDTRPVVEQEPVMLAYIETAIRLVPCEVLRITRVSASDSGRVAGLEIQVKVTADTGPYKCGGIFTYTPQHVVPRTAVPTFGTPFPKVLPYSWETEAVNAGIVIEGAAA